MFLSYAAQALSRDEFSKCFEPRPTVQPKGTILYWLYIAGLAIRYGILFPLRLGVLLTASIVFIVLFPVCLLARRPHLMQTLFRTYCKAWLFSFSAIIRHHGRKPSPNAPHLFVANHTSFIDYFLMSSVGMPHATVAQVHYGLFGLFQRYILSANGSLFFNRNENRDRSTVARRMQEHANRGQKVSPLIIFPEGTCVNNESTVLFHKGAFELDALICPVAIKYNKRLLDPYWNTREQTFTQHALYLMTRWMMIADVWWLPPQNRRKSESAIEFAMRVKALISETAGLRNLSWDGYMKNCMRSKDREKMRKSSQEKYVSSLRRRVTPGPIQENEVPPSQLNELNVQRSRRRANSLIMSNDGLATPLSTSVPMAPYLPAWLPDASVVNIKNELLMADARPADDPALALVRHIRERKDGIIQTWRYFSRFSRHSPPAESHEAHVAERRLENSSWRYWFKQRLEERSPSGTPTSLPDTETGFKLTEYTAKSSSEPNLPLNA